MTFNFIKKNIDQQKVKNRYRQRACNISLASTTDNRPLINVEGKTYINFSSNDYLGLNNNAKINKAMQEGIDRFGLSSSSSNLITGFNYAHQALEETICQWVNKPRCLLFSSGFAANLGFLHAVSNKDCFFLLDKLSHASIIDGAFSGKSKVKRFAHNDMKHLQQLLKNNTLPNKLIISEGIFSMNGDQSDVMSLVNIAKNNNAWLYLDDAHSIGVAGDKGKGSSGIISETDYSDSIIMATFGKAIATSGAFLACNEDLHDFLINFSRHYIYSTAMSPALAWATKKSIELIQDQQWRRDKIRELSDLFIKSLDSSIEIVASHSSIHAIIIGNDKNTLNISKKLKLQGFWLTPIRPPTVPVNTSRLRVTICSSHNRSNIINLANELNKVLAYE